jgi:hypothetical protein
VKKPSYRDQVLSLLSKTALTCPYDCLESYALIVHDLWLPRGRQLELIRREESRYWRNPQAEPVWIAPALDRQGHNWRSLTRTDWPLRARLLAPYSTSLGVLRIARLAAERAPDELWPLQVRGSTYNRRASELGKLVGAWINSPPADRRDKDGWLAVNAVELARLEALERDDLDEFEASLVGTNEGSLFFGEPS